MNRIIQTFIPIKNVTEEKAIALSKEIAQAVASTYDLPVFLYEKSASAPHRENLASVRKGEWKHRQKVRRIIWESKISR